MGLKTCAVHNGWANRDCNAWLAKEQVVRLSDAWRHPRLRPFLEAAAEGFSVRRSNGFVESGWFIQKQITFLYPPMIRYYAGEWHIPCYLGHIDKMVPLSQFIEFGSEDMREAALIAISTLDAGIYSKDYADHMEYFQSGVDIVAELPEVGVADFEGQRVRVWLSPSSLSAVQAETSDGPSGAEDCAP
jgi:hypothetical protein